MKPKLHLISALLLGFLFINGVCNAPFGPDGRVLEKTPKAPPFLEIATPWADSVLANMTLEDKIGQLFMIAAYSNKGPEETAELLRIIEKDKIGGVMFLKGHPTAQARITNEMQAASETPLLIAMDAEWGLAMRLDSTIKYPRQMPLGATQNNELMYAIGQDIAEQCQRLGVHVSFSPVADVNNNPANPVINSRSYGEDRKQVATMATAYALGLQSKNVLAVGKHFPGHGDTDTDSHLDLPQIDFDYARLDSLELYPFRQLTKAGLGAAMVAHLYIPALDSTPNLASTLSPKIVNGLLRDTLGFEGLVFTDALNMNGVSKFWKPGETDLKALIAGNDVLLFPLDVPAAKKQIMHALADSAITESLIDSRVHKILKVKEWTGAHLRKNIETENLYADLNTTAHKARHKQAMAESITMLNNEDGMLPLHRMDTMSIAILNVGQPAENHFTRTFRKHATCTAYSLPKSVNMSALQRTVTQMKDYDLVVVNLLKSSNSPLKNFGVTQSSLKLINALLNDNQNKVVVNVFANPYALLNVDFSHNIPGLLVAYNDGPMEQESVAEIMVGARSCMGKLPVSIDGFYSAGYGIETEGGLRMSIAAPEELGLRTKDFLKIDTIVAAGLAAGAYPGCRVLIAKDSKVIWDKSYGYFTYDKKKPVTEDAVYDLASITKVVSSTALIMQMHEKGTLDVQDYLDNHLDVGDSIHYCNMVIQEMLSHYARLKPWIPFYYETIEENGGLRKSLYRKTEQEGFGTKISDDLYISDSYVDSVRQRILTNGLLDDKRYRYSDLGYYLLKDIIEDKLSDSLENLAMKKFYKPLGLSTMGYLPLDRMSADEIVPTELDVIFRKTLVHGYVHDPGAAMIGGVGGHAGIFSNAWDLAVMMDMFRRKGEYGGQSFYKPETVDYFTTCHYCAEENRRGIGFDKPDMRANVGPAANSAPAESFGHSGFTGTLSWADPKSGLVYVFLSNRIHPNAENTQLLKMNIRTDIQQVIYDALERAQKQNLAQK